MLPDHVDVLIVGLGPTGAVLANLLGQQGWRVAAIDRDADIYYAPKAVHFDDEIMRIFQAAGLADVIAETAEPFTHMAFRLTAKGRDVMRSTVGSQDRRFGHEGAWWFHQPTLERQLHEGLQRFPNVTAQRGVEMVGLHQEAEVALARVRHRDGREQTVRARFVIGADGGRSFVRRAAGLELASAEFDQPWVVVDTRARCGGKDPTLPDYHLQVCDPAQPVTYVPMAGPYYEWQFMVMGGLSEREATDPAFVREQLKDFVDLDRIEITRIAYYVFHALWAKRWRVGSVVLAGDSAHQMPPFLGQGMCSGIRDAHSLAWRLDLVLAGRADIAIIDNYEAERSAHVGAIIRGAMFLGNIIQTRSRWVALLRNAFIFRLPQLVPPLKDVINRLAVRKTPLTVGCIGTNRPAAAGQLLPQPQVAEPGAAPALLDHWLGQGFALLARTGTMNGAALARLRAALPLAVVEWDASGSGDILDRDGILRRLFDGLDADFIFVRPDRYMFDAGRAADLARVADDLLARLGAAAPRLALAA
jgi:3-(3-hydroxy-phenyl)propionate hydroxylase